MKNYLIFFKIKITKLFVFSFLNNLSSTASRRGDASKHFNNEYSMKNYLIFSVLTCPSVCNPLFLRQIAYPKGQE
jgi:hypothetical protein